MRSSLRNAIASLPAPLRDALTNIFSKPDFKASISDACFQEMLVKSGLSDSELRLALLPVAAAYSIAPISQFHVGAIARGLSGTLYFGANFEINGVQLGQTIHAEQSAIAHAWSRGEKGLKDITVNYSPCGHCRQFMNELTTAKELQVQLPNIEEKSLHTFLPDAFGPADLGIEDGLMTPVNHGLVAREDDPLINAALEATNGSHAPYSHNHSGVALRTTSGRIYKGMYAENAAFNPSLPPLQVALINMNMASEKLSDITDAALVELSISSMSHLADTQATLEAINPDITLTYQPI
ncbi:cytidine deaminase [Veronia nyctiphanis]|uniref:Cytidine deaminase n=1 Tax=Veronia nyctiphanis TaxID=1278244 RepID=A0A4Q0YYC6_9GAMM|nr:cytidine deaminase [Veronia nyctiphanis]RXJ74219.1 cytidine deaminase [Veronia nyctiphanis]